MVSIFFRQRNETHRALLCDEGVYCITKEIQLLRPDEFWWYLDKNVSLPLQLVQNMIVAMEKFLDQSGISKALYKSAAFLKGAAETNIMKGGD